MRDLIRVYMYVSSLWKVPKHLYNYVSGESVWPCSFIILYLCDYCDMYRNVYIPLMSIKNTNI